MGVIGSFCQLCRLPLQHDHYVESAAGMLKIYRGSSGANGGHDWEDTERPVRFTSEHAWLADAIVITFDNQVVAGVVEDGSLTSDDGDNLFIWEGTGDDGGYAFHRACHELAGSPSTIETMVRGAGAFGYALVDPYGGQLFEMREFVDHGKAWMLADPSSNARSRARIDGILAAARRPVTPRPATVADVIASDNGWIGTMQRDDANLPRHVVRYRGDLHPELDCPAYATLVWAMRKYPHEGMPPAEVFDELERLEAAVKAAVEPTGILVMSTIGGGQMQLLVHTRDEAATRAAIDKLATVEYENEADPAWKLFFEQMRPRT